MNIKIDLGHYQNKWLCGKTAVSNFLADATEIPYDYHPTQGVRILEFEIRNINVNNKYITKDIELWDCSGDHKFENCWSALRKDAHGVVLVYNENSSLKEIQRMYDYFVEQTKLGPERSVIFCYDPEKKNPEISKIVSSTFVKISHVKCDTEAGGNKLKSDFASFVSTVLNDMHNYTKQELKDIANDNTSFAR